MKKKILYKEEENAAAASNLVMRGHTFPRYNAPSGVLCFCAGVVITSQEKSLTTLIDFSNVFSTPFTCVCLNSRKKERQKYAANNFMRPPNFDLTHS